MGARPPSGWAGSPLCSPACLAPGPTLDRREEKGAGHPVRVVAALGAVPTALIGRVLAPSAPRKGGPGTATRKARRPWTEARSPRLAPAPRLWATPALSCPSCPQQSPEAWLSDVEGPFMLTRCDSKWEFPACRSAGVWLSAPAPADTGRLWHRYAGARWPWCGVWAQGTPELVLAQRRVWGEEQLPDCLGPESSFRCRSPAQPSPALEPGPCPHLELSSVSSLHFPGGRASPAN